MKRQDHPRNPIDSSAEPAPSDQLVGRMFSGFGHSLELPSVRVHPPPEEPYRPLRELKARPGMTYRLQRQTSAVKVRADSPAIDVMTDLTRVPAASTRSDVSFDEARREMIARGVRALFVVDEQDVVLGIITSTDIMGEKPIQVAQQRGIRHDEVLVRDVMTAADLLEVMELDEVLNRRVGDVVASLRLSGRQHALVIEPASAAASAAVIRGIFSLTQIARQLGLPSQSGHDVARTFAEIERAIGA